MSGPLSQISTYTAFQPEVGAVPFPGYQLLRLRGHGGFATVWESTTPAGGRVALKFMSSATVANTAREIRSLRAIQTLDHPNLLRILQVWTLPGRIVIAMDLADASLLDLLDLYTDELGRPIDIAKLGLYMAKAADALDFLNARQHRIDGRLVGLQHGDIKPNNILLVGDDAKLADYGLATPTSGPNTPCPRHGTAEYCAPEVFRGHLTDRSDQFSLAVTYHVLRTGRFPFPEPPAERERLKNYARPDPDLSALSAPERAVLARSLSAIPQDRHPTCVALIKGLLAANGLSCGRDDRMGLYIRPLSEDSAVVPKSQLFR